LERLRRDGRIARRLTLTELVETYLAQHDVQPVTIEKLRYLLSKATAVFGDRKIGELTSQEIAEWRMRLSPGYRFEATQALRQVLHRAVAWGMIDMNPAKVGVDNPVRRRKEQHPFESWAELEALAAAIGPRYGPMILFAAATGLRPAEWIALEKRDVDRKEDVVSPRRRRGRSGFGRSGTARRRRASPSAPPVRACRRPPRRGRRPRPAPARETARCRPLVERVSLAHSAALPMRRPHSDGARR
jgi:integrase